VVRANTRWDAASGWHGLFSPTERSIYRLQMVQLLSALTNRIFEIDRFVAEIVAELREPLITKVMTSVTGLGSAAAALVFLGLFYLAGWDDELDVAVPSVVLTGVVVGVLMLTVQRAFPPHPVCLRAGSEAATTSFPSGHAASVTVFALTAHRSDVLPSLLVAAVAVLVAVSRIYLGTHYLSDTITGVLIGVGAFLVARRLARSTRSS